MIHEAMPAAQIPWLVRFTQHDPDTGAIGRLVTCKLLTSADITAVSALLLTLVIQHNRWFRYVLAPN